MAGLVVGKPIGITLICFIAVGTPDGGDGSADLSAVIRVAADLSGYSDTNSVAVYTPAMNASLVSPTAGWNVGGNFLGFVMGENGYNTGSTPFAVSTLDAIMANRPSGTGVVSWSAGAGNVNVDVMGG